MTSATLLQSRERALHYLVVSIFYFNFVIVFVHASDSLEDICMIVGPYVSYWKLKVLL